MNKTRQQELSRWLKQQSVISRRWLGLSRILGLVSGLLIVAQAWLLARLLDHMIMENIPREALLLPFILLVLVFILRAWIVWLREKVGFHAGQHIRQEIRRKVLDRLHHAGPAWLFMAMVGMGAADANRRNFQALARLSGHFLDRLRGMETLRLFNRGAAETETIRAASQDFRQRTMEVLRLAFLSSGVLEFFASLSIALVAVYFGFSYLGELNFGHYGTGVTLFAGFLALILAPEFFLPLRDLGTFYHAKAQAVGAADSLMTFLDAPLQQQEKGNVQLNSGTPFTLEARNLTILSAEGKPLAGPLDFTLAAGQRVVLVGQSGAGKSSLLNVLSGFLPYQGELRVNGIELSRLDPLWWREQLSWVGQNPQLPAATLRENVLLASPDAGEAALHAALDKASVSEFLPLLPQGVDTPLGDQAARLSVGQAQRVAVARALLLPGRLLLLDEPAASLDAHSEQRVMEALDEASRQQSTVMVTHQLDYITGWDNIWVMRNGTIVQQGDFHTLAATDGPFAELLASRKEEI